MDGIQEVMAELRKQRAAIEEALIALERVFVEGAESTAPSAALNRVAQKVVRKGGR